MTLKALLRLYEILDTHFPGENNAGIRARILRAVQADDSEYQDLTPSERVQMMEGSIALTGTGRAALRAVAAALA